MDKRITSHIRKINGVLHDAIFIKQMLWVGVFGLVVVVSILANIAFLRTTYPNPPQPPDRILDSIPQNGDFVKYGEIFSQIQAGVMGIIVFSSASRLRKIPRLFFLLSVMFMLRGFAITLTPLAQITPPSEYLAESNVIAQYFYHGMFFSGHSSSALIQAFFFWNDRFRRIRITWFVLPLAIAQVAAMIIGHQHYSIDIFAAFFVVYFVLTFDFMRIVPASLQEINWMPWNTGWALAPSSSGDSDSVLNKSQTF